MDFTVTDLFVIASVIQGVFVGGAILSAPFFKSNANRYLAWSILILAIITYFGWLDSDSSWPDFIQEIMWEFLFPVTFFHYILLSLQHSYLNSRLMRWLYLPFFITLVLDTYFGLSFLFNLYDAFLPEESFTYEFYDDLVDDLSFLYNVALSIWGYRLLTKDTTQTQLKIRWLKCFYLFIFGVLFLWFLRDLIEDVYDSEVLYPVLWGSVSVLFWWVCYFGIYQLRIVEEKTEIRNLLEQKEKGDTTKRVMRKQKDYVARLEHLMKEENLYKNPDLSRQLVGEKLGISEGYLSMIINSSLNQNFVGYVNSYRITTAKKLLLDPTFDQYSLEAIGIEVGFKSRSAFYSTFKKVTNLSPGAFRKNRVMS